MPTAPMRAFLGFVAAAIAVLTFHQGMVAALHAVGWVPFAPYPDDAGAAVRRAGHRQPLLLGRALRRRVRPAMPRFTCRCGCAA